VHDAARLLRESGVLQGELLFSGPTEVCAQFLNWAAALEGLPVVRRLPGPLRLRAAIDRGWRPGLYLQRDHAAAASANRPMVAAVAAEPVGVEFA
jgi:hypothetical protein